MKKIGYLFVVCLVCLSCGNKSGNKDTISIDLIEIPTSHSENTKAKVPIMTFEKDIHDFGRLTSGESVSYSFKFTNTGNGDLIITACDATCGCTVADFPKGIVKPKESGYITVTFKSRGKSGQQHQFVTVISNAQPGTKKLSIRAQVEN